MKRMMGISAAVLFALACFILSFHFINLSDLEKSEITVEGTAALGSITWYTSTPLAHAQRVANAFSSRTGWDVKVVRDSTFKIRDRVRQELKTGSTEAEVLTIADIGTYIELKKQGRLLKYDSPHYKFYPAAYQDPGYWTVAEAVCIVMAYDREKLKGPPPAAWKDLLDPRWQGRLGMEDIKTAGTQYGQYYILREKLGKDFWRQLLSRQKPRIYQRTEELADALLKGEIDVAAEFSDYTVYEYQRIKGTPLAGVYPEEGVPLILKPTAVLARAKNPAAAKKFNDFLLSYEGQALMQRLTFSSSIRNDVEPLEGQLPFSKIKPLLPGNAAEYAARTREYSAEFERFLKEKP